MADDQGFLDAIAAEPADDGVRLIYADWLEDHGDPRCELIRVCQAMRGVPVWSDRYWELKARRNQLWESCPLDWLEATGYDGSYYDPVFRDGVPDRWWERWRLIREFVERWHGIAVPDAGGREEEVRREEERLGVRLPPSLREFVAFAHDLGDYGTSTYANDPRSPTLFHCAHYRLEWLNLYPALSVALFSLSDCSLGVAEADLGADDPPARFYSGRIDDVEFDAAGVPSPVPERPTGGSASLSLSIFSNLFIELPTASTMEYTPDDVAPVLARLEADFPIHARFDDADVYETDEMLVLVHGPRDEGRRGSGRLVEAIVRRPIPIESVPAYLFGGEPNAGSSGMLGPPAFRLELEAEFRRTGVREREWVSVLRRKLAEQVPPSHRRSRRWSCRRD